MLTCLAWPDQATAQARTGSGFALDRYTPTAAGEWSLAVDHPWYSSTRSLAAGLTFDYGHNPLVLGAQKGDGSFSAQQVVIAHQLYAHVDLAGSILDRVLGTLSLPVGLLELGGSPADSVAASGQMSLGDLRFGVMIRLFGQPYRGPVSLHLGGSFWLPWRMLFPSAFNVTSGDTQVRGLPRLVLGGLAGPVLWSLSGGVLIRPHAELGDPGSGAEANSELQLGAALAYASRARGLAIGPELVFATAIAGDNAFKVPATHIEALLGVHYHLARRVQISVGGGVGLLRQAGTPDGRALLRIAYAPLASTPDPRAADRDHDGVVDSRDDCPEVPAGPRPDPARPGCPRFLNDRDEDEVPDDQDLCPEQAQGPTPDPARRGCPLLDRDGDGVVDAQDLCPDVAAGPTPDGARRGCPLLDRDQDTIADQVDACPDTPGGPSADPHKHGCPGMVRFLGGQIVIVQPVFFATNRDVILQLSFEVLQSVADALRAAPQIKKVRIEGHTDNRGTVAHNTDLSGRRAASVRAWLIEHGIDESRLEARGFGPTHPITENKSAAGRAKNRRVDFIIVDPPQPEIVTNPNTVTVPDSPDQSDRSPAKRTGKRPVRRRAKQAARRMP
jgi:outer membrane protein OmpA-like peptidoglycan-associated protein